MNTRNRQIRSGLIALSGALMLGVSALATAHPTVTLGTITVRPDADTLAAAIPTLPTVYVRASREEMLAAQSVPVLPTVRVSASEEEVLAARIDPSDRIQIMATITVRPSEDDIRAAMDTTAFAPTEADDNEDFAGALTHAVIEPHRLRLDMPYYSFGKILTRVSK